MKIAYTTIFDAQDVHNWSGTPYYMSRAFQEDGMQVDYIGSLKRKLPPFFKAKQIWSKYFLQQRESPRFNTFVAQQFSQQVATRLSSLNPDVIVSPLINPIAYLDCKQPIVLWTDALYASLIGFYAPFDYHSAKTIRQGNLITQSCLSRCHLAIFSSTWAAESAVSLYGVSRQKIKVVPFGANLDHAPNLDDIEHIVKNRSQDKIKLLFLAKSWERKGGDIVLAVTHALHEKGYPVELTIIGYEPKDLPNVPYIKCLGFISKHTKEGQHRLKDILSDSHFLFVPSRAEAYGIVFCEANAFAVPCLTTHVGGISTIIKDHVNGMTFGLDAPISEYCHYIIHIMSNRLRYETMALNAYHEYITRLNWKESIQTVKNFLKEI